MRPALALSILLCACSTTIAVERPLSSDRLAEIDSLLRDRNAIVTHAPPGGQPAKDVASGH